MIVLKFPSYEERYDRKAFRYEFNRSTMLLKIVNKKNGFTDFFRVKRFYKKGKNTIFKIKTLEKVGVVQ
ncbi:MAG: hypothetical protein D6834_00515 [Aquificota bacterium]|nr:MAG: hypothetical protein D6834_00515 [Aquificota bacterium]